MPAISAEEHSAHVSVSADVAATPASVSTARLFAAAAARHFGFEEHAVEDIRLAVSEAVTACIGADESSDEDRRLSIHLTALEDVVRVEINDHAPEEAGEVRDDSPMLPLAVVRSLFPSASVTANAEGRTIAFELDRPPFKQD